MSFGAPPRLLDRNPSGVCPLTISTPGAFWPRCSDAGVQIDPVAKKPGRVSKSTSSHVYPGRRRVLVTVKFGGLRSGGGTGANGPSP